MKIMRHLNILYMHGLVLATILCSCSNHREQETTDSFSEDSIPIGDSIEFVEGDPMTYTIDYSPSKRLLAIADTVLIKNGIEAVRISGLSPQNEYIKFKDRIGRPITVGYHASETDARILAFSYGTDGRLILVREFQTDELEWDNNPENMLTFIRENDVALEYRFFYNKKGRLTEITRKDIRSESEGKTATEVIKASDGNHLEGDFRPVEAFWTSDLHGGRLDIHCHEVPDDTDLKIDGLCSWINFDPVSEFDNPPIMTKEFFGEPKAIPFGQSY